MRDGEIRSNIDVVLYALLRLEGYERKVHTEEIAYKAYELARERFAWQLDKYRHLPDKEPVRIALMDAAKQKNGCLVRGRSGVPAGGKEADGWIFTPAGVVWIKQNQTRIEEALGTTRSEIRPKDTERFQKRIHGEALFRKFARGKSLTKEDWYDFASMLNASPDAPKDVIVRKLESLRSTAQMIAAPVLIGFLEACREAFPNVVANQPRLGSEKEDKP